MRRLVWVIIFSGIVGQGALALTVTNGEVYSASVLEVLPSDPLRVSTGGKVIASHALVIGPGPPMSYFASATVTGEGSSIDTDGIYMYGRGSSLIVQNGGVVRSTSMSINGDQTEGIVYNDLINYTSVSGNGSLLDISGNLTIRSPDSPGAPGLPFDYPREIPAYLNVYSGGELAVGGEISIFNGSWLSLGSGGCLTVRGNFNGSMHGFAYNGGALSVEGQLSGLSTLEAGCRLETPDVLGDLTVHGPYAPRQQSCSDSVVDGALTIAPDERLKWNWAAIPLEQNMTVSQLRASLNWMALSNLCCWMDSILLMAMCSICSIGKGA